MPPRQTPCTLPELLAAAIRDHDSLEAIRAPDRSPLTYAGLGRQLKRTAESLAASAYSRGARIAVALPAGPEFAVALLAIASAATCAPLDRELGADVLAALLVAMRIDALLIRRDDAELSAAAKRAAVPLLWL